MNVMSTMPAPKIIARPTRNPTLRNGSFAPRTPAARSDGVSRPPTAAITIAGTPMRDPTIRPAPTVDPDRPACSTHGIRPAKPAAMPPAAPPPSRPIDRRSSFGSVSARRMFATACPDGYSSCSRSTRIGVYSMPTPMPNMPMQPKYSTSFQDAGSGIPSQTIAWISTHMPAIDATDAASVWM